VNPLVVRHQGGGPLARGVGGGDPDVGCVAGASKVKPSAWAVLLEGWGNRQRRGRGEGGGELLAPWWAWAELLGGRGGAAGSGTVVGASKRGGGLLKSGTFVGVAERTADDKMLR
jgi:hypothetical protein